jgi:hypothetical protein
MKKIILMISLILIQSCSSHTLSPIEICTYKKEHIFCRNGETYYERPLQEEDVITNKKDYLKRQKEISTKLFLLRLKD